MMSHLLGKSFKYHRRRHSTPPETMVSALNNDPRNTMPGAKAVLTDVPEHEELASAIKRHASMGCNAMTLAAPMSDNEAKLDLAKCVTQTSAGGSLPKNRDWLRLQQTIRHLFQTQYADLEAGEMAVLHEKVRTLGSSKAGPFLFDSFKREVEVCLAALLRRLQGVPRDKLLQVLSSEWEDLYRHILPTLDMIFSPVLWVQRTCLQGKGSTSVRQAVLVAFRDTVVTKLDLEDLLNTDAGQVVPDGIRHMLLILYNVSDSYPPTKTKLKLEGMLARILNPFLGFQGLYEGQPEPAVKSAEPEIAARRKSADGVPLPRKLSRPMSSQPHQIETLHELFLTALRKQPDF